MASCGMCSAEVLKSDSALLCEGLCEKWYHISCAGVTESTYLQLQVESEQKWYCPTCNSEPFMAICKELKELQYFLSSLSGKVPLVILERIPRKLQKFRADFSIETSRTLNEMCKSLNIKSELCPADFGVFDLKWNNSNSAFPLVTVKEDIGSTKVKSEMTLQPSSNLYGTIKKDKTASDHSLVGMDKTNATDYSSKENHVSKFMEPTEDAANNGKLNNPESESEAAAEPKPVLIKQPQQQEQTPQVVDKKSSAMKPTNDIYEVEDILDSMVVHGKKLFLVKWKNYDHEYNSWESKVNLAGCKRLINQYYRRSLYGFEKCMRQETKEKTNEKKEDY